MRNNSTWALSQLSPTPWPRDAWNLPRSIAAAFGVVVFATVPSIAYLVVAIGLHLVDPRHLANLPPDQVLVAQVATYAPLGLYLVFVVPRLARVPLRELGFVAPTSRDVGAGIAGTVVMWLGVSAASALVAALAHRHDTETAVALLQQMKTPVERVAFFAIACVLAPMIEELTFRVFLFNGLTRYVSIPAAIVASGIVFGIVHTASVAQLLTVSVPLAVGGMVLAYVYATTRNYWASVITHGLFNSISVVAIFVFHVTT